MSRTILVVDDSLSMRQMVSHTLEQAGYAVKAAVNGREGLEVAQANAVDLVVTDVNMPEMDGIALVRALRAEPNHRYTPILVLTTESTDTKKAEGKAAGATGWLVKPFSPDQLLKVVTKVLP